MTKVTRMILLTLELNDWLKHHKEINVSGECEQALRAIMNKKEGTQELDLSTLPREQALLIDLEQSKARGDILRIERIKRILDIIEINREYAEKKALFEAPSEVKA